MGSMPKADDPFVQGHMTRTPLNDMETEPDDAGPPSNGPGTDERGPGFVVAASADGEHLGAWLPIPEGKGRLLGRGDARADDAYVRIRPLYQRPSTSEVLRPFEHRALSRAQLVMSRAGPDSLALKNVGKCVLRVNGAPVEQATVQDGDVVELGTQLVLLCCIRPSRLIAEGVPLHPFGEADEHGLVGESAAAWTVRAALRSIAPLQGHALIFGATGTGKELVARALHALSRRTGRLTSRNAATLPESLVDAELFGNLKNYPNPGTPEREGLVGAAHEGTLFLDEFAELPAAAQAHLLRALDSGEYQRLGETSVRRSSFRLVAATNRPEEALRRDLLERFPFRMALPPLAERRDDIPLIARHLFREIAQEAPDPCARYTGAHGEPAFAPSFVRRLLQHPFAGNVRELRSLVWASVHDARGEWLEWPRAVGGSVPPIRSTPPAAGNAGVAALPTSVDAPVRDQVRDLERQRIVEVLTECQGNQTRAAVCLGMPRRTLVAKLAQYEVPRPRKK
jgi:DNA-binding NtrC family response regulator